MSWLYSQALVAEYSAAKFSDGELSAPWSGNLTPQGYSSPDRMTALSRLSRFGMTFAPLMADRGAELLTWFLAASLARTSVSRAKERESTASDPGYGVKWRGSLARFDPDSRSWKTAQHSLIEDSDACSVTWPRSGMTVGGRCYLLPTLGHRTGGNESGSLLPTPCTVDTGSMFNRSASSGATLRPTLGAMARFDLWPTPTSSLGTKGGRVTPQKSREGGTLIEAVSSRTEWSTPTVNGNYNRAGLSAKSGDGLATAVRETMATPTARDWRSGKASEATHAKNSRPLSEQIGGSLNPTWVEWLMGWPLGWTDLKPLATGKCHSAPLPHGDCLRHEHDRGTPAPLRGARLGAQDQGAASGPASRVLADVAGRDCAASGQGGCAQAESGRAGDAA
jgi:hypothetical protein